MQAELLGARNGVKWYTHTAVQPALLALPIRDANCLKCHQEVTQEGYMPEQAVTITGEGGERPDPITGMSSWRAGRLLHPMQQLARVAILGIRATAPPKPDSRLPRPRVSCAKAAIRCWVRVKGAKNLRQSFAPPAASARRTRRSSCLLSYEKAMRWRSKRRLMAWVSSDMITCRRMLANGEEDLAQVDYARPVHVKSVNSRATDRSKANNQGELIVPGEVIAPILLSRMIYSIVVISDGC